MKSSFVATYSGLPATAMKNDARILLYPSETEDISGLSLLKAFASSDRIPDGAFLCQNRYGRHTGARQCRCGASPRGEQSPAVIGDSDPSCPLPAGQSQDADGPRSQLPQLCLSIRMKEVSEVPVRH